jgi:hypothetical protein
MQYTGEWPFENGIWKWRKNPGNRFYSSNMLEKGYNVHQKLAHIICVPVPQGDVMELQRGLPFAAISVEISPLLACIQSGVAAKDDDYFTTV